MKRVVIESPYAGDVERNLRYARACLLDSLRRGEAPIASHLLLTQVLDDAIPSQRELGIRAGLAWHGAADLVAFYLDLGSSPGMKQASELATAWGVKIEARRLRGEWETLPPEGAR